MYVPQRNTSTDVERDLISNCGQPHRLQNLASLFESEPLSVHGNTLLLAPRHSERRGEERRGCGKARGRTAI